MNRESPHGFPCWHQPRTLASAPVIPGKAKPGQLAFSLILPRIFDMPERVQKPPVPWGPKHGGEGDGPRSPDISRPDTKELLKKMRKVDPNQSKRYRQRTGQ